MDPALVVSLQMTTWRKKSVSFYVRLHKNYKYTQQHCSSSAGRYLTPQFNPDRRGDILLWLTEVAPTKLHVTSLESPIYAHYTYLVKPSTQKKYYYSFISHVQRQTAGGSAPSDKTPSLGSRSPANISTFLFNVVGSRLTFISQI